MKINLNKNELTTIRLSLIGTRHIFEEATLNALKNLHDNPDEYYKYSDLLVFIINPLIEKIEDYLDECNS